MKEVPLGIAGRVSLRVERWEQLDPVAGRKLAEPISPNWEDGIRPEQVRCSGRQPKTEQEALVLLDLLKEYQLLGALERDPDPLERFVMSVYPVTKKEKGSWRLVANARALNEWIYKKSFKQEGLKEVKVTVNRGDWLCGTDLSNAYVHLDGAEEWRSHHQLRAGGQNLRWSCLFFGSTDAPIRFAKLTLLPVAWLRRRGARLVVKLDDFLTVGASFWEARVTTNALVCLLDWLGFAVNFKKSSWIPAQVMEWLGTNIHTRSLEFHLTQDKAKKYAKQAKQLLKKGERHKQVHVHELRVMCGQIVSTGEYVEWSKLRSNWIRWALRQALKAPTGTVLLPEEAVEELLWWCALPHNPEEAKRSFAPVEMEEAIRVETDWSGYGLAAAWVNELGDVVDHHHQFVRLDSPEHNNVGETRGITEGVLALALSHNWRNCTVHVFNDNVTAVSYVNRLGGRFPWLFELLEPFCREMRSRNIQVVATWLAGEDNTLADRLSRQQANPRERSLHPHLFEWLELQWGPHTLDCFATRLNTQVPRYFSWGPDANAVGRDFFKQQALSQENLYGNPPFPLIARTLKKILEEGLEMTLVLPLWPSRPWWPLLLRLLVAFPTVLPMSPEAWRDARLEPSRFTPKWCSIVCRLSGSGFRRQDFQRSISKASWQDIRRILVESVERTARMLPSGVASFNEHKIEELISSLSSIPFM